MAINHVYEFSERGVFLVPENEWTKRGSGQRIIWTDKGTVVDTVYERLGDISIYSDGVIRFCTAEGIDEGHKALTPTPPA